MARQRLSTGERLTNYSLSDVASDPIGDTVFIERGFSGVLKEIPTVRDQHPKFAKELANLDETTFR